MARESVTRADLVDAALGILEDDGVRGLTVRAVSQRAGCSTTGIYTNFGGKQGLLDALYIDGFRALDVHTTEPRTEDPARDIVDGLTQYRTFALANPALYLLMFASRAQGYEPGDEADATGAASLATFGEAVSRAAAAGLIDGDPDQAALRLWGAAHGYVMLELTGPGFDPGAGESVLRDGIARMLAGYRPR